MKERGELFLGSSEVVPKGSFVLAVVDHELEKGENLQNKDLNVVYVSVEASLADRFAMLGIARKYNKDGVDMILVLHDGEEVTF